MILVLLVYDDLRDGLLRESDEQRALEKAYREWTHAKSIAHIPDCECPQCITPTPAKKGSRSIDSEQPMRRSVA